ncbi:Acetylxylan esterase precursor [Lacunisphaera limnophila]|uniref:Acetylxylan esterase n=1 Tax=Lacunisphaera limnophila TaxID=1838286 RepID=A0A1D8ATX7_9BACT|nr:alpha/beta hydrolase [Lacunisphaera limnophila]AOS44316.1 Acetylxylan esterase precursor [Lacunisphaera limnophila]
MKFGLLLLLMLGVSSRADEHRPTEAIPLWPEGVPNLRTDLGAEQLVEGRLTQVTVPTLSLSRPEAGQANGTALIICPGGGYGSLSLEFEGHTYARWFNRLGITTFVLKYRLKEYGHPAALQDALRAVRLVRSRAAEFGLDPLRIGLLGSSAGGHVAATAGTLYDHPAGRTGDPLDALSARPDFLILLYPVITMSGRATHLGSRTALLGDSPAPDLLRLLSPELQVTPSTPPTLLVHTQSDTEVSIENSLLLYQALTRSGVSAEFHAFESGPHGIGMELGHGPASGWPHRVGEWLHHHRLISEFPSK